MEHKIKSVLFLSIIGFLSFLALVIIYCVFFGPAKAFSNSLYPSKVINVSAEGKVVVTPDIAKLSFAVFSEGKNPETLATENNKKMNEAITVIKKLGIEDKDIKTANYNLVPVYEYNESTRTNFIGRYTLTQTVIVSVRNLDNVGKILGELPTVGVNQVNSISFEVENPDKYLTEARKDGLVKAKAKALDMAKGSGIHLGKVINVSEYVGGSPAPYYGMGGGVMSAKSIDSFTAPEIKPGTQEITVTENLTYEIK